jgi:hypothetical protein
LPVIPVRPGTPAPCLRDTSLALMRTLSQINHHAPLGAMTCPRSAIPYRSLIEKATSDLTLDLIGKIALGLLP